MADVHCMNHETQAEKITCATAMVRALKESLDNAWTKHREHDGRHEANVVKIATIDGRLKQGEDIMSELKASVESLSLAVATLKEEVAQAKGMVKLFAFLVPIGTPILVALVNWWLK